MTFDDLLLDLLEALRAERAQSRPLRSSTASDDDLEWAVTQVNEAHEVLALGDVSRATCLVIEVARKAIDQWSLTASLTEQLAACAQALRALKDPQV